MHLHYLLMLNQLLWIMLKLLQLCLLKQRNIISDPPNLLVTDKGTENFDTIIANMCIFLALNIVQNTTTLLEQIG